MDSLLHDLDCGPCPYLEGREWMVEEFSSATLDAGLYEELLGEGFRRSGISFYKNRCSACGLCVPIRLDVESYKPSKTLRRLARVNADLSLALVAPEYSEERYELYSRYTLARHSADGAPPDSRSSYEAFLLTSPLASTMITEYRLDNGQLAATGYVDLLPMGISSVYFAFDPLLGKRSVGLWSVARELELARSLGKRWYYLGFWVPGSRKMDYKARFAPFEYAQEGRWIQAEDRGAALAALGVA
jgi:arginine-tRNA-protein transferase